MIVSLIAAIAENGVIGRNNDLPWKIRDDMRFFVNTTRGHTVITGRRNFDAMGRPLPQRRNLIVSRDPLLERDGAEVFSSIESALRAASLAGESEAFVIGGAQIYALAYPYAHRFYRTRVLSYVEGDVYFPQLDWTGFSCEKLFEHRLSETNDHDCVIERLERKAAPRALWESE